MKQIAIISSSLGRNGISNVIMNYCLNLDNKKYQITLFVGSPFDDSYLELCKKKGINVVKLPARKPSTIRYYVKMIIKMKKNYYDVIHINGNSTAMAIELWIAKIKKIPLKIAHCHNANCANPKVNKFFKNFFEKNYNIGLACSENAGNWVFGSNNFYVLPNGFEVNKFIFNKDDYLNIRKQLNLSKDSIVLGHTGRLNDQKNQEFLINILPELIKINKNYILLLVGNGPNMDKLKELAKENNCQKNIIFYGESNNIEKLYSVMDIFVFPSKYEGLGISLLEAQINGLSCIASDQVPAESDITGNVIYISTNKPKEWINSIKKINKRNKININSKSIQNYNIQKCANFLEKIYDSVNE